MADRIAKAVLELSTDTTGFNRSLGDVEKRTETLKGRFASAGKSLQSFGSAATNLGSKLTLGLTAPIVGIGAAAIKFATDFNASMANVATLIPGNTDRINELKGSVQTLAIETGKSTSDLAEGLYLVISAFGDTADTAKILETNAKAAAAGLSTTEEAIQLTSAVTKGYGDTSAAAVRHASDLALQTVKLGQTTFPELASSIGLVTPLAAELNVKQTELFGTMATFTGVTGSASQVSTQLRGVLQALMAPTKDMTGLFGQLGVDSGKALIEQRGLHGAMKAIVAAAEATGTPLQKFIGSIEGQTIALSATGAQSDTYSEKLAAMTDVAGATDEAFREQTEGVNKAGHMWNQLTQELVVVAQQLGDVLIPIVLDAARSLRPMLDLVKSGIRWFSDLPQPVKTTSLVIVGLVAAIGPLLTAIGAMALGISAAMPVIAAVGGALGLLATGPVVVVVAAIVGLVAAWVKWGDDVKRITGQVVGWLTANFGPPVKAVFEAVKGVVVALKDVFVAAFELQLAIAQKVGQGIVTALKAVLAFFGVDWKDAVTAVGAVFEVAKDLALGAVKVMVEGIKAQFAFMLKVFDTARGGLDKVTGWFQSAKDVIVGNSIVPDMINAIGGWFSQLPGLMGAPTQLATQGVTGSFAGMAGNVGGIVGELTSSLAGMINKSIGGNGVVNKLVDTGMGVLGKTVQGMLGGKGFVTSITGAGMDALKGIVGDVMGTGGNIVDTVKGGWNAIKSFTSGGLKATNSLASSGMSAIAGTAAKFMGPAGAIAEGVGALFGEGTTGQKIGALVKTGVRVAAGVMTGGMSEMALAAYEGVKVIGGWFKKMFTKPSADELAGRDVVVEFHKNIAKMLTEQQKVEAKGEAWRMDVIFLRDAYKKLGLSSVEAQQDAVKLWGSSKAGAESSKAAVEAIINKLQGGFRVPITFDVPELKLPSVTQNVKVKRMAAGGFGTVTEPTLFLAGEAGREDFAFSGANKSFGRGGDSDQPIIIHVTSVLDGEKVAQSTIKHMPRALARAGLRQ